MIHLIIVIYLYLLGFFAMLILLGYCVRTYFDKIKTKMKDKLIPGPIDIIKLIRPTAVKYGLRLTNWEELKQALEIYARLN